MSVPNTGDVKAFLKASALCSVHSFCCMHGIPGSLLLCFGLVAVLKRTSKKGACMAHTHTRACLLCSQEELVNNEVKRQANMTLLRSLGVFFGEHSQYTATCTSDFFRMPTHQHGVPFRPLFLTCELPCELPCSCAAQAQSTCSEPLEMPFSLCRVGGSGPIYALRAFKDVSFSL